MFKLSFDYRAESDIVTGQVEAADSEFRFWESVELTGYQCAPILGCPDDEECEQHSGGYWVQALEDGWYEAVIARGLYPVYPDGVV